MGAEDTPTPAHGEDVHPAGMHAGEAGLHPSPAELILGWPLARVTRGSSVAALTPAGLTCFIDPDLPGVGGGQGLASPAYRNDRRVHHIKRCQPGLIKG
jgi:hypothetical protein